MCSTWIIIAINVNLNRIATITICFFAFIKSSQSLNHETLEDGTERKVLSIPPALAPYKVAVLPLMKKEGMPELAREIIDGLKIDFNCQYDEKDNIGRRYRRQDAIGTPFAVTVDQESLIDKTVTIRDRDTMKQDRVAISDLHKIIEEKVSMRKLLVG